MLRIALVAGALVVLPVGVFAWGRSSTAPCHRSTLPTPQQMLAIWKQAHPGYTCRTSPQSVDCTSQSGSFIKIPTVGTPATAFVCLPRDEPPADAVRRILDSLRSNGS